MTVMRNRGAIPWQRLTTLVALLLPWALLAAWQWQEYEAERETARETLRRQADSLMNALVGGVRSHRRLGRFLEEQLQGVLDELAKSQDVLAVAVVSADGKTALKAGKAGQLKLSSPIETGQFWDEAGFRCAVAFQLPPDMPGPGPGMGPGMGQGMGPGRGGGWGRGGPARQLESGDPGPTASDGRFVAVLLLDRARTDQQIQHYALLRILVVAAGGLVILSVTLAWRATMRLADARGRTRLLETEARHLRELSQAAAGLAHETRNPLGLIRGWTQRLAQSLPDNPQQHEQAQAVIEECDRVTARINQFLAFARPCEPKLAEVRLAEVIAELAGLLEPDLDAKHLMLARGLPRPDETMQADREMLRQALFNLLQNAVVFSPEGGSVEIAVRTGEDSCRRIEVADRGPGVAREMVDLLFTPYHTTRSGGTGLGLAIVRRIATAHDWRAGYTPRPDGGSIFWLDGIHG